MPSVEALTADAILWRHELHAVPELLFDLPQTASFVAEKLRAFGCDAVETGIAKSGVVGVIRGRLGPGRTIMLRSDMDALPMQEQTNLAYSSKTANMMHACGHDGHMAILLATARYLTQTRDFAGTAVVVFQPAEEGGAGGRLMIEEGVLERFGIDEVFGMHNKPGVAVGSFATRPGPLMAAGDRFVVTLTGKGGHASAPHLTPDPVLATAHLVTALQSIAARYIDPFDPVVVSTTFLEAGNAGALNVIPAAVRIGGSIRTIRPEARAAVEARFRAVVETAAKLFATHAEIDWRPGYPVTINDPVMTIETVAAAARAVGEAQVDADYPCIMGSEDFSYMLQKRPGAIIWLGNGDSADLHHPSYDFNDGAIVHGIRYWTELVQQRLGAYAGRRNVGVALGSGPIDLS